MRELLHPLPAYRVRRRLLFRWNEVERWLEQFRVRPVDAGAIAEDVVEELNRRSRSRMDAGSSDVQEL